MRSQSYSDFSSNQVKSTVVARDFTYADLDLLFKPNPVSGDINPVKDLEAVKRSIKNLILTNYNERPFQPEIGSGVRNLLFELADPITAHEIEETIKRAITNFEPRVEIVEVTVSDNFDFNEYTVDIEFLLVNNEEIGSVTIILERLR
jgi:phage baseplate assembly protein W